MKFPPNAREQLHRLFGVPSSDPEPRGKPPEIPVEATPSEGESGETDDSSPDGPGAGVPIVDVDDESGDSDEDGIEIQFGETEADADGNGDGIALAIGPGDGDDAGLVEGDTRAPEPVPFEDTIADRDERIDDYAGAYEHEDIRQQLRESGVAERIQQRLDRLFSGSVTQPQPRIRNERPGTGIVGGRPDMRQVVRRFAGDLRVDDVFEDPQPGYDDDLAVGVVLDLSGSMANGDAERAAKEAAGAFLFGVQKFGGDVVAVSYPHGMQTVLMTGAREPFRWRHLDAGKANGGTPTSTAVADGTALLAECSADSHLLLVLTDGGANSVSATREAVENTRERGRGWGVVGFGYGNISERKLEAQFGDDGYRAVNLQELPDALVDVYRDHHPRL